MAELPPYLTAVALRGLVDDRQVTARELVESSLRRIDLLNEATTAVVALRADAALREADAADNLPADRRGILHGLPLLIKDITETLDLPTTYGSRALRDNYAPAEAVVVTRLRQAGAIIIGKSNTPETGLRPTTENLLFGATRNPWNLGHTPGGSSGGAAAALSAGMVAIAQGTDAAGSGRIPASCCAVVGLKPSRGLVPLAPGSYDLMAGMGTMSPMARTVEDTALLLDAISGGILGDPYARQNAPTSFAREVERQQRVRRIGICLTPGHGTLSAEVRDVIVSAACAFEDLADVVEDADIDLDGLRDAIFTICAAQAAAIVDAAIPDERVGLLEGSTLALARRGWVKTAADYVAAVSTMRAESARMLTDMDGYDYVITPTLTQPPPRLEALPSTYDLDIRWREYMDWMAFVYPANCTGQPAISVPAGFTSSGLPVGLQIIGRPGDDGGVLALAAAFSQIRPWSDLHPSEPVFAAAV